MDGWTVESQLLRLQELRELYGRVRSLVDEANTVLSCVAQLAQDHEYALRRYVTGLEAQVGRNEQNAQND